jgi:hypothetical protein
MNRFIPVFSLFFVSFAHADGTFIKDCTGTSDQGAVEVQISKSSINSVPESPLQGYFQADVLVNGATVYSTPYIVYNANNGEYFTSGNSDLVLSNVPDFELYLHVWNADGTVTVPSFDVISLSCR